MMFLALLTAGALIALPEPLTTTAGTLLGLSIIAAQFGVPIPGVA